MAKKANYTPYFESIGWEENGTNGVVFGVAKKFKNQADEARNKAFRSIYNLPLQIALACRVIKML